MAEHDLLYLDDCISGLEDVRNMLILFEEAAWDEVKILKESEDGFARNFFHRYDMMESLLNVAGIHLFNIISDLRKLQKEGSNC